MIMMMRETVTSLLIQLKRLFRKLFQPSWSLGPGQIRHHNINKVGCLTHQTHLAIHLLRPCLLPLLSFLLRPERSLLLRPIHLPPTWPVLKLQVIDCPLSVPLSLSTKLLFGQRLENRKYNICFGIILPPKLIKTICVEQINYEIVSVV